MKKCPACEKTFEDSMRFCQIDGTSLVDDVPFDPYATIVGQPGIAITPAVPEPEPIAVAGDSSSAINAPDEVLDSQEQDPLKTMYVSDSEMQDALGKVGASSGSSGDIIEIEPINDGPAKSDIPQPEPPTFSVPDVPPPSFGDMSPPPSPFSTPFTPEEEPMRAPASYDEPSFAAPKFNEAETMIQGSASDPFAPPVAQWSQPAAQDSGWQNQDMATTPFQPTATGSGGQNKTLAIISLVVGILSMICCSWFVPGIAAIVLGFIARSKAKANPAEYGGEGLALGGIITGGISLVLGVIVIILYLAGALAGSIGNF